MENVSAVRLDEVCEVERTLQTSVSILPTEAHSSQDQSCAVLVEGVGAEGDRIIVSIVVRFMFNFALWFRKSPLKCPCILQ